MKEDTAVSAYAKLLRERLNRANSCVMISREKYFADTEKRSRAKRKPLRRFKVGDLVTRHVQADNE